MDSEELRKKSRERVCKYVDGLGKILVEISDREKNSRINLKELFEKYVPELRKEKGDLTCYYSLRFLSGSLREL